MRGAGGEKEKERIYAFTLAYTLYAVHIPNPIFLFFFSFLFFVSPYFPSVFGLDRSQPNVQIPTVSKVQGMYSKQRG